MLIRSCQSCTICRKDTGRWLYSDLCLVVHKDRFDPDLLTARARQPIIFCRFGSMFSGTARFDREPAIRCKPKSTFASRLAIHDVAHRSLANFPAIDKDQIS